MVDRPSPVSLGCYDRAVTPPRLLDGGLATELESRGISLDDPLWSGRALLDHPQVVAEVHEAFARAGADVLTTATYQLSDEALRDRGLDAGGIADLYRRAVDVAAAGSAASGRSEVWLAASIGSLGAALGGGEEYRGSYLRPHGAVGRSRLRSFHTPRLRALLADPRIDVVLLETFPAAEEVLVVAELIDELTDGDHPPVWASLTCVDADRTSVGEPLRDAATRLRDHVDALGVNCTDPRTGREHVASLRRGVAGGRAGVLIYPNAGEYYGAEAGTWVGERLGPPAFAKLASDWIAAGLVAVGGCCRTAPGHIAALRAAIDAA